MSTKADKKRVGFHIQLNDAELDRFRRVALHHEMPVAAVIRMLMKREAERIGAAQDVAAAAE